MSSGDEIFLSLELCEVFEHPSVFEGVVDDGEQFSGGCDDRFAGAAPLPDAVVEGLEVGRVAHGDEAALDQRGARQLVAALGDSAPVVGFVGLADAWHHAEVSGKLVGAFEVMDIADGGEQHGG